MRLREVLLASLLALAMGLIVYSVSVSQQQQYAVQTSRQLLQQVYVRALREYYQWLSAVRELDAQASLTERGTMLSPYIDTLPPEPADWQLTLNLDDLQARLLVPESDTESPWLALQLYAPEWPHSLRVRLDLLAWLEQLTTDLGYGVIPVEVHYRQQHFRRTDSVLKTPRMFTDFLLPELTLVMDAEPLHNRFRQHSEPLLSALLATILVFVSVLLVLQQWYRRQRVSQALADTETNLLEQMRLNARQRETLQDNSRELQGLNQHLQKTRQQLELSERLAGLGELSAGIAHEINNPVSYVRSNLQELHKDFTALAEFITTLDKASDELDLHSPVFQRLLAAYQELQIADVLEQAPARLHDCQEGIERASRIVSDMRKLSRIGHGKQWCQVNDDIGSVINIARARLPAGVELDAELTALPSVYCNPSQIAQVVMNILVNAIQALEVQGGKITLREQLTERELQIVIRDNGPGMDEQTAARVFEPFFTTKIDGEGTGLGLALCHKLMQAHAGRIDLQTRPGEGAVFTVVLPLSGESENAE